MTSNKLRAKYICITGASSGIGLACAEKLFAEGHHLILGARRFDKLEEVKKKLSRGGPGKIQTARLDVTDDKSVEQFCAASLEFSGGALDVLINNAGLALGSEHVKDGSIENWQTVIDTNIMGVLRVTRKILPHMIAKNCGQIVFLSSIAAHQVYEGGSVYAASKHAVRALAKTLKLELNGTKIRINTIDPGMVNTEFSRVRFFGDKAKADKVYEGLTPLSGADIADCVEFVINRPPHVNIDEIIVMPTDQATVYKAHRQKT